jgi:hypothetical protein
MVALAAKFFTTGSTEVHRVELRPFAVNLYQFRLPRARLNHRGG